MRLFQAALLSVLLTALTLPMAQASNYGDTKSVKALDALLQARPELAEALKAAIISADMSGISTIAEFETYINSIVRLIPTSRNIDDKLGPLYIITDVSDTLRNSDEFEIWSRGVIAEWGHFLDSSESIAGLPSFYADPAMKIEDYYVAPSGWLTFNQFFAREIKPGKRPIAGLADGKTVVSPGDSVFKGAFPITDDATLVVKGITHKIRICSKTVNTAICSQAACSPIVT